MVEGMPDYLSDTPKYLLDKHLTSFSQSREKAAKYA